MRQDGDTGPESVRISMVQHFEALPDPREGPNAVHKLIDIIVISVCAVIAGCEALYSNGRVRSAKGIVP
jgi:hypothetical protein